MKKRILSMLLVIVMVLSLVPVSALADSVTITGKNYMAKEESVELTLNGVTATGSVKPEKDGVVQVDWNATSPGKCTVTGVGPGRTNIIVSEGTTTKTFPVAVYEETSEKPVIKADTIVELGSTPTLTCEYTPTSCDVFRWYSSKPSVATINYKGELTTVSEGTTDITVFHNGQTSAPVTFEVKDLKDYTIDVTADPDVEYIMTGRSLKLSAVLDGRSDLTGFDWSVSEADKDKVELTPGTDNTCTVKGKTAGSVTICVSRVKDGKQYTGSFTLTVKDRVALTIKAGKEKVYTTKTATFSVVDADDKPVEGVRWSLETGCKSTIDEKTGVLTAGNAPETITVKAYLNDQYTIAPMKDFQVVQNTMTIVKKGETEALTQINVNDVIDLEVLDKEDDLVKVTSIDKVIATGAIEVEKNAEGVYKLKGLKSAASVEIIAKADGFNDVTQTIAVNNKSFTVKNGDEVLSSDSVLTIYEGDSIDLTVWDGETPLTGIWYNRSKDKITVDKGSVTGIAPTETDKPAEIVVGANGYDNVTVKVKVLNKVPLTGVTIDDNTESPVEVRVGQPKDLEAVLSALHLTFKPADATHKNIKWTSDNSCLTIENVDGKDMLVANTFGEATVTGTYGVAPDEKEITFAVRTLAADGIEVDPTMPLELICGESMDLKAVLKNTAGETLETPVQWRLKNDKVIKNLVDLTANKLTAYPQSTYDFTVELEAFIEGNDQVEVVEVPIHVLPRTTNIALKKGDEDISDKTIVLNVNDPNGITIDAVIRPSDAKKIVEWHIDGPANIYKATRSDKSIKIEPVSTQKTGTITVTATAKDGTNISRKTTIVFARMADSVLITNAPAQMRGGANIQLRTNLDEDETITDRRVKWSVPKEFVHLASVTVDGLLDTKMVTERTTISVEATLIANPEKKDVKPIELCPAVNIVKIVMEDGTQTNGKSVVDFADGDIQLDKIAYPAGHIGSKETDQTGVFVWTSSNEKVATVDSATGKLTLHDAGNVRISCTAYDTDFETALKIARGEIRDDSKVMAIGYKSLEIVKAAGYVEIEGATELISGKNTTLKATVYTDDGETLAGNQKVTWSVEDVYGNPTKAATINSRGRLYAKTVNYGTEVVVYATSVEDKEVIGEFHVNILPKKEKAFAAFLEDDDRIIEAPLYMNTKETALISGRWYIREFNDFINEEDCLFFSSNPAVATIGQNDGALETKKNGSTTITVRATDPDTRNVYTAKFTLYVVNAVDHIVISKPNNTPDYVRSGSYMYLSATVWSNVIETIKADNQGVTWGVYEENDDGDLVATKAAYMTSSGAIVANSVTENTPVIVVAASKENPSVTAEYPLTIRPAKAYTVTARCMDEDSGDMVVPTSPVNLEVMPNNTPFSSEIMVEVYASDLSPAGWLLNPKIIWETSDKNIAKVVDGDLYYTGRTGKVKVTPTFKAGNVTYRGNAVTLNIMKFVDSIEVTKKYANQELYSGKSLVMYAIVDEYATTRRVTWSLIGEGDSAVASINPTTGLIRAKKGLTEQYTITVRATAVDGSEEFGEDTVTIFPLATKVTIKKGSSAITSLQMVNGTSEDLTVEFTPVGEANDAAVKWTSSRSSVVSVDKEGNIIAKRKGTATIKAAATDGSGKYATIKVTVK